MRNCAVRSTWEPPPFLFRLIVPAVLNDFRSGLDFKDITYTFLRDFEQYLREKGNADNTIAKHMKQLRILVNEAINQGYMHADAYPFRN